MSAGKGRRRGGIRIIGGQWRGRRVLMPGDSDVRPTSDRIRETLFNWLAPVIEGARCLDLFAGTGVLGIEALSRGAAEAWFVERDEAVARALESTLTGLNSTGDRIVVGDAMRFLEGSPRAFDIVFVDPPYETNDLGNLCTLLDRGWLAPGARVYLEMPSRQPVCALPADWTVLRDKTAGGVRYALAQKAVTEE